MSYLVYQVSSIGAPRNHLAIFVQTKPDETGQIFQVTGNIQAGMTYETKPATKPEDSVTFIEKELLGTVTKENLDRIDATCRTIPAPKKQFDGPKRLYPQEPLRRCQEWTGEAVEALKSADIINS